MSDEDKIKLLQQTLDHAIWIIMRPVRLGWSEKEQAGAKEDVDRLHGMLNGNITKVGEFPVGTLPPRKIEG